MLQVWRAFRAAAYIWWAIHSQYWCSYSAASLLLSVQDQLCRGRWLSLKLQTHELLFSPLQMLEVSNSLFTQSLQGRRGHSAPLTSQLLLVLSDGRGVFADGTTVCQCLCFRKSWMAVPNILSAFYVRCRLLRWQFGDWMNWGSSQCLSFSTTFQRCVSRLYRWPCIFYNDCGLLVYVCGHLGQVLFQLSRLWF